MAQYMYLVNVIYHINRFNGRNQMLNSLDTGKAFGKNAAALHDKNHGKSRDKEDLIQAIYNNPTVYIRLNAGKFKEVPIK